MVLVIYLPNCKIIVILLDIFDLQGGGKVIIRCSFVVIFLKKNFGSACEISLIKQIRIEWNKCQNRIDIWRHLQKL